VSLAEYLNTVSETEELFFSTIILIYYKKKYPTIDIYSMDILPSEKNILNEKNTLDMGDFKIWFYGIFRARLHD